MTFSDYLEEQEMRSGMPKPWKARRKDVLTFWNGLQTNLPLQPSPINKHHTGTRFREDGLRITGSSAFVNSVMSHLKDFLRFETDPRTKLDVEYRQIERTKAEDNVEKKETLFREVMRLAWEDVGWIRMIHPREYIYREGEPRWK